MLIVSSMVLTNTSGPPAQVIIRKVATVTSGTDLYAVDSKFVAKYVGLQNAMNEADKRYIAPRPCESPPCIGPYYAPPDTSYSFTIPLSVGKTMVNDPSVKFVVTILPDNSNAKLYDTNMKLGNS